MSGIKRYDHVSYGMVSDPNGEYIFHSDHEAEVARLRAELQNAAKAALDAVALSCEKEREADALRAEVHGLRDILPDASECVQYAIDYGSPSRQADRMELLRKIDAAMGASA